ncbi:MAG: T9SS type A sorting domain-containing protein, partial [Saprospiraceae bacterium]|nr:T9SS type A sorting domain-containing protein [Saprospiraceae bacterium]
GFIQFSIYPVDGLPQGTAVGNSAAIYFDQNKPVITNTVWRTYGEYYTVKTDEPSLDLNVTVAPNPFMEKTTFTLSEKAASGQYRLVIFDALGKQVSAQDFTGNQCTLQRDALPSGVLFWNILKDGERQASGRIIAAGE